MKSQIQGVFEDEYSFQDSRSADKIQELVIESTKNRPFLTSEHYDGSENHCRKENAGKKIILSWSGGKDTALALNIVSELGFDIVGLFTLVDMNGFVSCSAPFSIGAIRLQAKSLGIPHKLVDLGKSPVENLKDYFYSIARSGIEYVGFGYISPDGQRDFVQKIAHDAGLKVVEPLCERDSHELIQENLKRNIAAVIVAVDSNKLPITFLGKQINMPLIDKMKATWPDMDYCGENGEFQTLVIDCRQFKKKISIKKVCRIKIREFEAIYIKEALSEEKSLTRLRTL